MTARAALIALVSLLVGAAPAQATLFVRSDGAGLFVQDQNGANDNLSVETTTRGGRFAYSLVNLPIPPELIPYDIQAGCSAAPLSTSAVCDRNGTIANFVMGSGNDEIFAQFAPGGTYGVNMGSGDDEYTGNGGIDNVHGLSGKDRLVGRDSNDDLDGGSGDDRMTGDNGNDDLSGDAGDDRIGGNAGNDMVAGGDGADFLVGDTGDDTVSGGDGNDSVFTREPTGTPAVSDTAGCGFGVDYVEADLKDFISASCEQKDVSAVGETPLVRLPRGRLTVRRSRLVRLRLRCPRGVGSIGCKGRLSLRLNARGARRTRKRYRIGAGHSKTVTLRLSRGSARTLRRRQRRGRRTVGVLASVEKGRLGRKTTVRNPRLRLR